MAMPWWNASPSVGCVMLPSIYAASTATTVWKARRSLSVIAPMAKAARALIRADENRGGHDSMFQKRRCEIKRNLIFALSLTQRVATRLDDLRRDTSQMDVAFDLAGGQYLPKIAELWFR